MTTVTLHKVESSLRRELLESLAFQKIGPGAYVRIHDYRQSHEPNFFPTGSHVRVIRMSSSSSKHGLYDHHMLVTSVPTQRKQLNVIHYSQRGGEGVGSLNSFGFGGRGEDGSAEVLEETVTISDGDTIELLEYPDKVKCFSAEKSIQRATQKLGEKQYSVISNNCESFVNWVITDKAVSKQVQEGLVSTAAGFVMGAVRGYFKEGGDWSTAVKEGTTQASSAFSHYRENRN